MYQFWSCWCFLVFSLNIIFLFSLSLWYSLVKYSHILQASFFSVTRGMVWCLIESRIILLDLTFVYCIQPTMLHMSKFHLLFLQLKINPFLPWTKIYSPIQSILKPQTCLHLAFSTNNRISLASSRKNLCNPYNIPVPKFVH